MPQTIQPYSAMIVDDNEIDRLTTAMYVRPYSFIKVTAMCNSASTAIEALKKTPIDVFFLDIDMPGMDGLALRQHIGFAQACIFITAYPDYAVEGFEHAALDFIVKPLQKERFARAMIRLQDYLDVRHKAELFECSLGANTIFIKDGHSQVKIQTHEVIYLEALKDYTSIVTNRKKYCVHSLLGSLLQQDSFKSFVRIHRSYAVQKNFIKKITSQELHVNNFVLPIGRSYKHFLEDIKNTP